MATSIVISGMPMHTTENDMRNVFTNNEYGDVISVTKERESGDGEMARFTVIFYARSDAERGIKELAPTETDSNLYVALEQPTEAEVAQSRQLSALLDGWRSRTARARRDEQLPPMLAPVSTDARSSFGSSTTRSSATPPVPFGGHKAPFMESQDDDVLRMMSAAIAHSAPHPSQPIPSPRAVQSPIPFDPELMRPSSHGSQQGPHLPPPAAPWQQQQSHSGWAAAQPEMHRELALASVADAIADAYPQRVSRSFDSLMKPGGPDSYPDWSPAHLPPRISLPHVGDDMALRDDHHRRSARRVGRRDRAPTGMQGGGESASAFELDLDRIASGQDQRTTLMVRNIPNKYTQQAVLEEIDEKFRSCYDCFYLPIDFKNKCNVGYAFLNLCDYRDVARFFKAFDGRRWSCYRSAKVCAITYARIQGKASMIARFQNSNLMNEAVEVQPRLFRSFGPAKGAPEEFPALR